MLNEIVEIGLFGLRFFFKKRKEITRIVILRGITGK